MTGDGPPPRALAFIQRLATSPRDAGTPAGERARRDVAAFLASLGLAVEEHRFAFSPAGLRGFPIMGAGIGWLALVALPLLVLPDIRPWLALASTLAGGSAVLIIGAGVALGWSGLGTPNREDANLVCRRPGAATVRRWIVAHYDTKAQGHSMAGRLVAVWVLVTAVAALVGAALWRLAGPVPPAVAAGAAGLAVAAGVLAGRGRLQGESPGARDNASGLLALLVAAERGTGPEVGFIVTGAEEFGLIGSRILAQTRPELFAGTEVINLDTVDDRGLWRVVTHGAGGEALVRQVAGALAGIGPTVRRHRLPFGILVDSLPLARAGATALTVARLDWTTFRLIHTPRDTTEGLSFASAVRVGRAIAALPAAAGD